VLGLRVWDVILASSLTCCPVAKKMLRAENRPLTLGPYVLELRVEQRDGDYVERRG
jgi:hypothetical protein